MRIPFSYKTDSFGSLLALSFLTHAVIFSVGSFSSGTSPRFAVREAPSSMEVVILEKEKPAELRHKEPAVAATLESHVSVEKPRSHRTLPARPKARTPLVVPPDKGALSEFDPVYLKNPPPVYPRLAREEGWQGLVILHVFVGPDGRAGEVEIAESSGHEILDEAALKAVEHWNFLPARAGGLSFSSWIKIPIRFLLIEEA